MIDWTYAPSPSLSYGVALHAPHAAEARTIDDLDARWGWVSVAESIDESEVKLSFAGADSVPEPRDLLVDYLVVLWTTAAASQGSGLGEMTMG